jgi:hypothetical protein
MTTKPSFQWEKNRERELRTDDNMDESDRLGAPLDRNGMRRNGRGGGERWDPGGYDYAEKKGGGKTKREGRMIADPEDWKG